MSRRHLPYGRQWIDEDDIAAVTNALRSDYLTTGPAVSALEEKFADIVSARHAISCMNGTAALHLAVLGAGLTAGDYAVVPAITFLATANAVIYTGATPVFSDVDPDTGLMTPEHLLAAIEMCPAPPRAILPVHLGGPACQLDRISAIAQQTGAQVIEDACHALGTSGTYNGQPYVVGDCQWSQSTVFSAHPVKTFTMGEGGIVTTNDDDLADRLRKFRSHGMIREPDRYIDAAAGHMSTGAPNPWYYEMQDIGYNYRATDIQCALGLSQLRKLDRFLTQRELLVARYQSALSAAAIPGVRYVRDQQGGRTGWHLFRVNIDFAHLGLERGAVMASLAQKQIGTQVHYIPLYRQPYYNRQSNLTPLAGAERYYAETLSLPLYPSMTEDDVDYVVNTLKFTLAGESQ